MRRTAVRAARPSWRSSPTWCCCTPRAADCDGAASSLARPAHARSHSARSCSACVDAIFSRIKSHRCTLCQRLVGDRAPRAWLAARLADAWAACVRCDRSKRRTLSRRTSRSSTSATSCASDSDWQTCAARRSRARGGDVTAGARPASTSGGPTLTRSTRTTTISKWCPRRTAHCALDPPCAHAGRSQLLSRGVADAGNTAWGVAHACAQVEEVVFQLSLGSREERERAEEQIKEYKRLNNAQIVAANARRFVRAARRALRRAMLTRRGRRRRAPSRQHRHPWKGTIRLRKRVRVRQAEPHALAVSRRRHHRPPRPRPALLRLL
jgi:hypothetical protein